MIFRVLKMNKKYALNVSKKVQNFTIGRHVIYLEWRLTVGQHLFYVKNATKNGIEK